VNTNKQGRRVIEAVPSPHVADVKLPELRAYRQRLQQEEDKVSYWRRLVHARMDMLNAGSHADGTLSLEELVRVLGDTGTGRTRTALSKVSSAEPLPDLPESANMWVTEIDPRDGAAVAEGLAKLADAEEQLTAYRRALHLRLDEVTGELISRYRENPAAALGALPN